MQTISVAQERIDEWRNERSLFTVQISVSYIDAILGSTYKVQTSSGSKSLLIPPGTQHGSKLVAESRKFVDPSAPKNTATASFRRPDTVHSFEVVVKLPLVISSKELSLLSQISHSKQDTQM